MSDTVVRVEHLGKKYKLMHQTQPSYTTLGERLSQTAKKVSRVLTLDFQISAPTEEF